MLKRALLVLSLSLLQLLIPVESMAAPLFCLNAQGLEPQCHYYSANACHEKALKTLKGYCSLNPTEMEIPDGPGLWCLITSTRHALCYYDNFSSCQQQSKSKNGVCIRSLKRPLPPKQFESQIKETF